MVGLVLRNPGVRLLELVPDLRPVLVLPGDRDRCGPLYGEKHTLDRETPFVLDRSLVAALDDLRVRERHGLVFGDLEDEQPLQDTDLGRGEADPVGVDHQLLHTVDELSQVVVEVLDRASGHLQGRIRVLADLRERQTTSRLLLGVELLFLDLSLDLRHFRSQRRQSRRVRYLLSSVEPTLMKPDCTLADVDPRTLNETLGQGATRAETPRERREREQLEADLQTSPVRGKPLRQRLRNFRPDPASGVQALSGPTAWMRRLRAIEDAVEENERRLSEEWRTLASDLRDPAEFAAAWREIASEWSFAEVNELIERHNRNFPAEARLAMDPRTRDFVRINGRSYVREPLDEDWILERFPADRGAALR